MTYSQDDLERAQQGFSGFVRFSTISIAALVVTLLLMRAFLI